MKKTRIYLIIAVSAATLMACEKTETVATEETPAAEILSFKASIPAVKTVLSEGTKMLWEYDDEISVYNGTSCATFTNDLGSGTNASATYSGTLASASNYYAMYPDVTSKPSGMEDDDWNARGPWYVDATVFKGPVYTIPASQTAVTDGIQKGLDVLVASTDDATMSFDHACAALKFTVGPSSPAITEIKVGGSKIVGNYYYRFDEGHVGEQGSFSGSSGAVTLSMGGSTFPAGDYYIMIAVRTYSSGLSFTFTRSDGKKASVTKSTSFTPVKGHVYPMGTIGGLSFQTVLGSKPSVGDIITGEGIVAYVDEGNSKAWLLSLDQPANGKWADANEWIAGKTGAWTLPSYSEFQTIRTSILAAGTWDEFNALLSSYTQLQKTTGYWTSTVKGDDDTQARWYRFYKNDSSDSEYSEFASKTGTDRPIRGLLKLDYTE